MPSPPGEGYRVSCSDLVTSHLKALLAKADRLDSDRREQFRMAFRRALFKLHNQPLTWGEPERDLDYLGLTIYHAVSSVLNVYYTVLEEQLTVVIKSIDPVQSFPLEAGPDENA